MCEFNEGDIVIMSKPRPECSIHKGVVGVILELDEDWHEPILQIDTLEGWWTLDQFEMFKPTLENK